MRPLVYYLILLGLTGIGVCAVGPAHGQVRGQDTTKAAAGRPRPDSLTRLRAADNQRLPHVAVLRVRNPASHDSSQFKLNDYVTLDVRDLRLALRRYNRPVKDLRLFVDDIMLPMSPVAIDTNQRRDVATVRFQLVRNQDTEPTWQIFYKVPGKYKSDCRFNVGFDSGQLGNPPGSDQLSLELVQQDWVWVGVGLLVLLAGIMYWLTARSNLIRSDRSNIVKPVADPDAPPGQVPQVPAFSMDYKRVPFSLAKSQVAYWTFVVVAAYSMIYFVTSALPTIPSGLLGLLGISITNGLFSKLINKTQADTDAAASLRLTDGIGVSRGWLSDVLTDTNGVSIVRLQFIVFNAVVGIYVVQQVVTHWSLPNLDASILALISISSLGFLAQKNSEGPSNATNPAAGGPAVVVNVPVDGPAIGPGGGAVVGPGQLGRATGAAVTVNVHTVPAATAPLPATGPADTAPVVPTAPPDVLPDGTPTRRADEADDAATAANAPAGPPAAPFANLGLG